MIYIKNNSGQDNIYRGFLITNGAYLEIKDEVKHEWYRDENIFNAVSSGQLIVAKSNDGNGDIQSKTDQWSHLIGDYVKRNTYVMPQGGKRVTDRGFQFTAIAGQVTNYDFQVTENLFIKEGFALAHGFDLDDNVSMSIVHPLTNQVIHYYLKNIPLDIHKGLSTTGIVTAKNEAITETNFNGLIIRMTYDSKGSTDVKVGVTMRTYS